MNKTMAWYKSCSNLSCKECPIQRLCKAVLDFKEEIQRINKDTQSNIRENYRAMEIEILKLAKVYKNTKEEIGEI